MASQKQVILRGDYLAILNKAAEEGITACLIFMGKEMGVVRVFMVDGQIRKIDSTWGVGRNELDRILEWRNGMCRIKTLTPEEIEELKEKNIVMTSGELILKLENYGTSKG